MTFSLSHFPTLGVTFSLSLDRENADLVPQVVFDEASAKVFFNPFYPNITQMSKNTLPHSFLSTERLILSQ